MRILFDSSTLIAAIVEAHQKHEIALSWLLRAKNKEFDLIVSAHTLLEIYCVLTKAPFKPKISSLTARKLIETNIKNIAIVQSLNSEDYFKLLDSVCSLDLKGGIVYDALIYRCAIKSNAKKIVTLNTKDFNQLNIDESVEIISL